MYAVYAWLIGGAVVFVAITTVLFLGALIGLAGLARDILVSLRPAREAKEEVTQPVPVVRLARRPSKVVPAEVVEPESVYARA